MKKISIFVLCMLAILCMTACEDGETERAADTSTVAAAEAEDNKSSGGDSDSGASKISITIDDVVLYAELNSSKLAQDFAALLPQTISMQRVGGGREFYGSLQGSLNYDESDSQTTFENGEIAYWFSGNGLCLLYNNQVDEPEVESGIIILGQITSDFSILYDLDDHEEVTVELIQ